MSGHGGLPVLQRTSGQGVTSPCHWTICGTLCFCFPLLVCGYLLHLQAMSHLPEKNIGEDQEKTDSHCRTQGHGFPTHIMASLGVRYHFSSYTDDLLLPFHHLKPAWQFSSDLWHRQGICVHRTAVQFKVSLFQTTLHQLLKNSDQPENNTMFKVNLRLTCMKSYAYPYRDIRHVPHSEGTNSTQDVQGHVSDLSSMSIAVGDWYTRGHHTTLYPYSDGYFQLDNAPCHRVRIISDQSTLVCNRFNILRRGLELWSKCGCPDSKDTLTFSWRFNIRKPLSFQNLIVAIVCDFEHKTPINNTIPGFEPSMTDISMVQSTEYGHFVRINTNRCPANSTLIRSRMREDLNIQSSLTSSFSSRSSKLPREQNSVTMAKTPQSWKKPRNGLYLAQRARRWVTPGVIQLVSNAGPGKHDLIPTLPQEGGCLTIARVHWTNKPRCPIKQWCIEY
ncbi:hypothetical protein DNTS_001587 [Danionella cerebrum]|uniref:Uncharacterized protein n=1 Tax=Danionella cerebrum TaxID=2873325 RepID=A0A553MN25_9TELE|nr:hypothetical protein DNTS_001587 [Danionella translucida]